MITIRALGSGRYPKIFDSSGSNITNKQDQWPAAHFGTEHEVAVRPVKDDFKPYTLSELTQFVSFDFGLDVDWNTETDPQIRTTSGFSIEEVVEDGQTWAQIVCTVDFGTDEAKAKILALEHFSFKGELDGYRSGKTKPGLISQFPFLLLGRVIEGGTGSPNPVGDGHYSSAQVDALVDAKLDKDFSGFDVKATLVDADTFAGNDSEDAGGVIVVTCLKIWNYIKSKLFPGSMTIGNLVKYGTDGILEDAALNPADVLVDGDKGNLTEATSSVLTITGGTGATIGNVTIQVKAAGTSQSGYLSITDWNKFNGLTSHTTINFTSGMTIAQMQALINAVPKNLGGYTLTLQFGDGTYNTSMTSQLVISNFYNGSLYIYGNSGDVSLSTTKHVFLNFSGTTGGIYINHCNLDILLIAALKIQVTDNSNNCVTIAYCSVNSISVGSNYFLGSGLVSSGAGLILNYSRGYSSITNTYFSNISRGIIFYNNANFCNVYNCDDIDTPPKYGIYATKTIVYQNSNSLSGSIADIYNDGGAIFYSNTLMEIPAGAGLGDMIYLNTSGLPVLVDASEAAAGYVPTVQEDKSIIFEEPFGEANTASSAGAGTGIFYQKSGVDLQFKSLKSTDSSITVTGDTTEVDLALADTIPGTKTFSNFPITPSSAPTTAYQVANKKYVDDNAGGSPLTTKGDLYTYNTGNARFPVGTNGQILSADSTETTGLKWVSAPGGGNMLSDTYDPAAIGEQLVGLTAPQTLTNKILTSPILTTPQINDTSADHQYIFAVSELTADRTVTLPLLTGNDEFVFKDFTQTFTNKTLSTGTVISEATMTLGSDADGDIYYRASNKLARLAKGTAAQVLTMNAGATAPEWANASGGGAGNVVLSAISGEAFIYPKTGITNPFSNAANSPNISFDVSNYADAVALLSTSSNEPMQLPKFKIPAGTTSLKFRFVYSPETGNSWNSETVVWKGEWKNMTDNVAWSSVTAFSIGTDTAPASGSAPQLYEATVSLATLGLAAGDVVQMTVHADSTSTWAHDVAFQLCEIEVAA